MLVQILSIVSLFHPKYFEKGTAGVRVRLLTSFMVNLYVMTLVLGARRNPGGGTAIYGLYRYVPL